MEELECLPLNKFRTFFVLVAKHFSRFVGVDVCQLSFDAVAKNAESQVVKRGQFDNVHDGFSAFSLWLNELSTNESYRIIVAIECTGPYHLALVRFLKESGVEVFLFNGQTAKNLARAHLKEKKTDTLDAEILANLLIDGKFPTSAAQSDNEFIAIRSLSRRSSRYTQQIACAKTRLKDELCQSSLGMLKVFPNQAVFSKAATELMKLYPLPTDRLAAGVEEVTRVLSTISRNHYGKKEALKRLAFDAQNLPDERLCDYFRQSIRDYICDIQYFQAKREEYATQIQSQTKDLKPAKNLLSLPGCGEKLMPIVLSEVFDINRFASADKFVGYAGLAPVEHESGPYKGEKHLKKGGCPRLSYACYLIAHHARRKDERLKNWYQRVKHRHIQAGKPAGITHIIASCAVAREVARLIYAILNENRKYFSNPADYKAFRAAQQSAA